MVVAAGFLADFLTVVGGLAGAGGAVGAGAVATGCVGAGPSSTMAVGSIVSVGSVRSTANGGGGSGVP